MKRSRRHWLMLPLIIASVSRGAQQPSPNRLVLVSIDGLSPDLLERAREIGVELPALDSLRSTGVTADGLVGIYPTVTYPLHTTLVTGARPDAHGIITNYKDNDWYIDRSDIRTDTLWDAAERAGLETAVVSWPASFGAKVDFLVPEYLGVNIDPTDRIRGGATPGLLEALEESSGTLPRLMPFADPEAGVPLDTFTTRVACWVLEKETPDLLLTHLLDLDHRRHEHGPYSERVLESLRFVDGLLSTLIEATARAGTRETTTFVVVGDHGFEWTHTSIVVDALLVQAGIDAPVPRIIVDAGSAAVYLPETDDVAAKITGYVSRRLDGVVTILDRRELDRLGAYPGASFALEAAPGFSFTRGKPGDGLVRRAGALGSHGFLPSRDRMAAAFIANGPAVAGRLRGVRIPKIRMIDVAPTLAAILGITLQDAAGFPIMGLITHPE